MRATTRLMKEISEMSEIEHWAAQKILASKTRSLRWFLWGVIYAFSRQEKDKLISSGGEKIAASLAETYGSRHAHS